MSNNKHEHAHRSTGRLKRRADELLRIPQAVEYLSGTVSPKTVRGWIFRKQIEVIRINGVVTIPRSALDRLIERGRVPAEAK
jgi:hypothetical protein